MQNLLIIAMVVVIIVPIIIGLLLGMLRGSRRSMLRLIMVILCLVAAFFLRGVIVDQIMQADVSNGQSLESYILDLLGDDLAALGDVIIPVIELIVTTLMFLILFFGIKFITWLIIFPICKIFVKKARRKRDGTYASKHPLIGGVIGLVQGAAIAVVLCVVLHGLFFNVANVMEAMNSAKDAEPGNSQTMVLASEGNGDPTAVDVDLAELLSNYKSSKVCNMLNVLPSDKMFDLVASMKTEDGKKITLTGQLNALTGLIDMGKQFTALEDMNMKGGLSGDLATELVNIFNSLDEISKGLSDESKETMNQIVQIVVDNYMPEMDVDLSILDFTVIDFANEGQVITKLSEYKDLQGADLTSEKAGEIVSTVMQSDILLPILSSNDDFTIGLNEQQQAYAESIINDLESQPEADQNKIEMLKQFFGLNDNIN